MNPQAVVAEALQKGWLSLVPVQPAKVLVLKHDQPYRQRLYDAGLTARGKPPKPRRGIPGEILAAAERDGVTITAIYNRRARTGRLTLRKEKL